jgi:signal transduction histidine kinase
LISSFLYKSREKNIVIKLEKTWNLEVENNVYYLDRLFWNLLSNAIFYNKWNNEIKVIVYSDSVEIIDKWIWIEKTDLEKIFNRFYRNANSGLYYKNWNWLWLTIAQKICDIFWWKIEIESEVWVWSIFRVVMK